MFVWARNLNDEAPNAPPSRHSAICWRKCLSSDWFHLALPYCASTQPLKNYFEKWACRLAAAIVCCTKFGLEHMPVLFHSSAFILWKNNKGQQLICLTCSRAYTVSLEATIDKQLPTTLTASSLQVKRDFCRGEKKHRVMSACQMGFEWRSFPTAAVLSDRFWPWQTDRDAAWLKSDRSSGSPDISIKTRRCCCCCYPFLSDAIRKRSTWLEAQAPQLRWNNTSCRAWLGIPDAVFEKRWLV